jgi:hypothetical protein
MALTKTTMRFSMSGLDQGVDPKLAKGMLLLQNARQNRQSEYVKRNGQVPMDGTYSDKSLATYRGRPVLIGNSGVYTENPGDDTLIKVDDAGFMDLELINVGVGGNCVVQVCQVLEGGADFLIVSYIKVDKVSSTQTEHLEVYDRTTGRLIDSINTQGPAILLDDGTSIYYVCRSLYYAGSGPGPGYYMQYGTINVGSGAISTPATDITDFDEPTAGDKPYDACVIDTNKFAIIHIPGVQPGGSTAVVGEAQLIIVEPPTHTRVAVSPGESDRAVSCWLQAASLIGFAVSTDTSDLVRVGMADDSPAVTDALVSLFDTSDADDYCSDLTGIATSSTEGRVYFSLGPSGGAADDDKDMRVVYNSYEGVGTTLAAVGAVDPFEEGCRLASQPFVDSDGVHFLALLRTGDYLRALNRCYLIKNQNDQIFARFLMDQAMGDAKTDPGFLFPVTDRTDAWTFGAVRRTGYETSGVVAVRAELVDSGIRAVEAHGLLVLPGSHPWVFDGTDVTELGFVHFPRELTITPGGTLDILNDIKTQYEAHRTYAGHNLSDTSNLITADDATTLGTAYLLANDIKDMLVKHGANNGGTWHSTPDTITISAANATDYASLVTLTTELLLEYNTHRIQVGGVHADGNDPNEATEDYDTSLDEGLHGYQAIYERYLKTGHRDQSAPSPLTSFDPDGDFSGNAEGEQIRVVLEQLHHTKQGATIVLYRTDADLAVPYRLQMQTVNTDAYEATLNDGADDDDTDGEPYPYTTGGVLENLPPPPSRVMWVHQERLFAVNREEEDWDVRYSKQFVEGEGIAFNDVLELKCSPAGGRIIAGASLMGRGVLFKKSSIYTFYGKGYTVTGAGAGYSVPELINPAVGCVNQKTLVEVPQGLMFESEDGIYLLTKQWQAIPIGRPAKYLTDNLTLSGVIHVKDRHQVIWCTDGEAIVYDYVYNTWSSYTGYASSDLCVTSDNRVFRRDTSTGMHYENRSSWVDVVGELNTQVPMLIRSAWISVAEYQKLHSISVLGQALSDCTLTCRIAYDFALDSNGYPDWTHEVDYDINGLAYHDNDDHYGPTGGDGTSDEAMLLNVQVARRCRSFLIEIAAGTRQGQATVTKGVSITGLELLVSQKKGAYRPGSGRQMTSGSGAGPI